MHFLVSQLANYWLQLEMLPNVLSISGCDTEHRVKLVFHHVHELQHDLQYDLNGFKISKK